MNILSRSILCLRIEFVSLLLAAAPIWSYNFENDSYSVPVGVGVGKVMKKGKTVYNMFVESQFSVADDGPGQPEWQIFMGLNLQLLD